MKLRLSYGESMTYCIDDAPQGGWPVEVPDEQAERWRQASDNWAKAQLEMKAVMQSEMQKRRGG